MGQRVGKVQFVPAMRSFLNMPFDAIMRLWSAFNDIAEGFGLSPQEFRDMCLHAKIQDVLKCSETDTIVMADEIFAVFDSDKVRKVHRSPFAFSMHLTVALSCVLPSSTLHSTLR